MTWVQSRWPLIARLFAFASAVAGMAGVPFTLKPFAAWGALGHGILAASALTLLCGIVFEIRAEGSRTVFDRSDKRGIRDYMYRWIEHGGPVAVWTRDHSWVDDDEMRAMLIKKAKNRELTFCVPHATQFSRELEAAGASVLAHGLEEPAIRFTIAQFNKNNFTVAVARNDARFHIIEEYSSDSPNAALAKDLVSLVRRSRSAP